MILHLVLKRKWYDMIASGEKKEEYRATTPYWTKRILEKKDFIWSVAFHRGYTDEFLENFRDLVEKLKPLYSIKN